MGNRWAGFATATGSWDPELVVPVAGTLAVGALVAGIVIIARGGRSTPLERLATWLARRGLTYVPSDDAAPRTLVARFAGTHADVPVTIEVRRTASSPLADAAPLCIVATAPALAPTLTLHPVAWVMDVEGRALGVSLGSGDAAFDEVWALRCADAGAARAWLTPARRAAVQGLAHVQVESDGASVTLTGHGVLADEETLAAWLRALAAFASDGGVADALTGFEEPQRG